MISGKIIRQAVYQRLNVVAVTSLLSEGSASLFHNVAPPAAHARYPLVVISKQAGTPSHQFGGAHFDSQVWLVKAIDRNTKASDAETVQKAIADRLDFGSLPLSTGRLMGIYRESDVDYTELDGDQQYHHRGCLFRVVVE